MFFFNKIYFIYLFFFFKILLINILFLIILTLIIASITLLERKVLSLSQRRIGPYYVGYKGRLQYIADALKLFLKNFIIPNYLNKFSFVILPSILFSVCYSFWVNSFWSINIIIIDIEYNIIVSLIFSSIFTIIIILTGYFSRNKYAFLASIRSVILLINLEILFILFILIILFFLKSFSVSYLNSLQEYTWLIFSLFFLLGIIIIIFFLETGRAPFDLHEAESELVSGYNTEYSSFYFALFYLGEYFHLFFFIVFYIQLFFGFIEFFNLIYILFFNYFDII